MSTEDEIFQALSATRGPQLMRELARQLAETNAKIALLEKKVSLLTLYNEEHSVLLDAEEPVFAREPKLACTYELLASDFMRPEDGFHGLEHGDGGVDFRWAAPEGFMVFRPMVDRSLPLRMTAKFVDSVSPQNFEMLSVFDGDQPAVWSAASNGRMTEIVADLPARAGKGASVITIRVPFFQQLSPEDGRVAGVTFHKFEIAPAELLPA